MFANDKRSYLLTQAISFFTMCELLLLNIKKLIRYNVLTKRTSFQMS